MDATSAVELLEAQPRVWDHSLSYIKAMTLQCAVEMEIADVIQSHGEPIALSELAAALEISAAKAPFLSRLMRMLVHMGYFTQVEQQIVPAPLSQLLLKNNPFNARSLVICLNHPNVVDPWRHMSAWFRSSNDDNPFAFAHGGKKLYEVCSADAGFGQLLAESMGGDSWMFSRAMVANCKEAFEGLSSLVDVGGSTGTTAKVIAEAFPSIHCTVFDLPNVVAAAAAAASAESLPNLDYVGGDMFTDDIPPADALLFKWVLLDWPDEACLKVLKQCRKALLSNHVLGHESCSSGGGNSDRGASSSLLLDLMLMAVAEGCLRSEKQWGKLFSDAGFSSYVITPVAGLRSLIQVYP
ncbi:unnamed protein product [Linum tenue]|uniref:Uncharacterized protein n=1 Tax=Linum tenue TaxID=586396 RepID=A0AAV0LXU8_9ROSI|nr:unnamed protein product [Linum tenue]